MNTKKSYAGGAAAWAIIAFCLVAAVVCGVLVWQIIPAWYLGGW